jgi:DtxR family Mn-dependent transcriptional regulator
METLQRLTRRQVETLGIIAAGETPTRGVPLKSVAAALKVRPPSALSHLTPLEALGLISRHRGKSRLTPRGRSTWVEYRRHHRVAEQLFAQVGFSPEETCRAAREIDLAMGHVTVDRLCRSEGHPPTCPHGQPIDPCQGRRGSA